jgi:hypothetical protein
MKKVLIVLSLFVAVFAHAESKCDLPVGSFLKGGFKLVKAKNKAGDDAFVYVHAGARIEELGHNSIATGRGVSIMDAFRDAMNEAGKWCGKTMANSPDYLVRCIVYKPILVEYEGKVVTAMDTPYPFDKEICTDYN